MVRQGTYLFGLYLLHLSLGLIGLLTFDRFCMIRAGRLILTCSKKGKVFTYKYRCSFQKDFLQARILIMRYSNVFHSFVCFFKCIHVNVLVTVIHSFIRSFMGARSFVHLVSEL